MCVDVCVVSGGMLHMSHRNTAHVDRKECQKTTQTMYMLLAPPPSPSLLLSPCCCFAQCGPKIATYPWPAEELVSCVSRQTGLTAAAVERPTVVQNPLFPVMLLGSIVVGGAVAWKLYNSPVVRITGLWTLGALAVYWFATSGGMYNIIRGIPFSIVQNGKKVYWMEVSGLLGCLRACLLVFIRTGEGEASGQGVKRAGWWWLFAWVKQGVTVH